MAIGGFKNTILSASPFVTVLSISKLKNQTNKLPQNPFVFPPSPLLQIHSNPSCCNSLIMPRIGGRERSKIGNLWRFNRFIDIRCLAPPTLDGDGDVDALSRMPYRLLPRQDLIDLFVLKLDGSVFGDSFAVLDLFFFLLFCPSHLRTLNYMIFAFARKLLSVSFFEMRGESA